MYTSGLRYYTKPFGVSTGMGEDQVVSYESGDWEQCSRHASTLEVKSESITTLFLRAVEWADGTAKVGDQWR